MRLEFTEWARLLCAPGNFAERSFFEFDPIQRAEWDRKPAEWDRVQPNGTGSSRMRPDPAKWDRMGLLQKPRRMRPEAV